MSRPNNRNTLARRLFIGGLAGAGLAPLASVTSAQSTGRSPSPAQTLGPFYPRNAAERPRATDADLLTVEGERVLSKGVPIFLAGRVVDRRGNPVADAAVEIWQCDANAVYHHPGGGAESERDPYFQGYGVDRTDAGGDFRFRTIRPVAYPGRTPHGRSPRSCICPMTPATRGTSCSAGSTAASSAPSCWPSSRRRALHTRWRAQRD